MGQNFEMVTEVPGVKASQEQLAMLYTRYAYAADFCVGKDVLEVACGSGSGLGFLDTRARTVVGGDLTSSLLDCAHAHYGSRVRLVQLDAQALPFTDGCFDVVLLYEAIYYLRWPEKFLDECRRVLRDRGMVILCSVNNEWPEFNPSPYSTRYYSAHELAGLFTYRHFTVEVQAGFPAAPLSFLEHVFSVIKRIAVRLHLIPKTMKGKEFLKRLVFGRLLPLPPEVVDGMAPYCPPVTIQNSIPVSGFKVLYAIARR
jgi:ubiquinone/menaquinone biosynthesis C-methylase UbiE